MSKHTEGPWTVETDDDRRYTIEADGEVIVWEMGGIDSEANARLIAQSPTMYEFVREHLDAPCYCEANLSNTPGNRCRVCRAHEIVNAVEGIA